MKGPTRSPAIRRAVERARKLGYVVEFRDFCEDADTPGLLPHMIVGSVVNLIDASRPFITGIGGARPMGGIPGKSFGRPRITQHTNVEAQSAEKAELTSQKMIIEKVPVTPVTYGGYLNVSRQLIDWTQPQIMDIVIQDLAGQYAMETEDATATALLAAATAGATGLGTTPTAEEIAAAYWSAAGAIYAATSGAGRVFSVVAPYQSFISCFGTPWGFILASKGTDPRKQSAAEIDRLIAERMDPTQLGYWDGQAHLHSFNLPKFLRAAIEKNDRVITDQNLLIVS